MPDLARSIFHRLVTTIDELYPRTPVPELPREYRAAQIEPRINAVAMIVDRGLIVEGTVLEFRPGTAPQRSKFAPWLAKEPRRGRATWTNDRAKPLIWEIDREQYSPDGLLQHMTSLITGKPSAARQGVRRWYLAGQGCLTDIAETALVGEAGRQEP